MTGDDVPPSSKDPIDQRLARLEAESRSRNRFWAVVGIGAIGWVFIRLVYSLLVAKA